MLRRRPQHGLSLGSLRAARRIGRHGRTVLVGRVVDIFAIDILRAGAEGGTVLAPGVLLFEAVEFDFCTIDRRLEGWTLFWFL